MSRQRNADTRNRDGWTLRHGLGGYREMAPPAGLAEYVESLWRYRRPTDAPGHRVLPTTGVSLCLRYLLRGGRVEDPELILIGPVRAPRFFAPPPGLVLEAVQVKPEWARKLLSAPPEEHEDALPPLRLVQGRESDALLGPAVAAVRAGGSALPVLLGHVERRVAATPSDRMAAIASAGLERLLADASAGAALPRVAADVGVTARHLRRAVRSTTGAGPKYLQRVHRLVQAIERADREATPRWSTLAVAHGFYDQAHLINECRALAGRTPVGLHAERRAE